MNKNRLLLPILILLFVFGFAYSSPSLAGSASLYPIASTTSLYVGNTFTATIKVNTAGAATNAYQATVRYPTDKVQAIGVSKGGSVCQLWVRDPSYSNGSGTANFECGTPANYNGSSGTIGSITFRATSVGTATISLASPGQVLAADGSGTNLLGSMGSINVNIVEPPKSGPTISSSTHPDQEAWTTVNNASFTWTTTGQDLGYSVLFDQNAGSTPAQTQTTTTASSTQENIADGVWYLHVRTRFSNAWSVTSHYKIQIDTTAPAEFTITVEPEGISETPTPTVYFATTDAGSGVERYEVSVDDGEFSPQGSPYTLPPLTSGSHIVTVKAIDFAGNKTFAKTDVQIKEIPSPKITVTPAEVLFGEEVTIKGTSSTPNGRIKLYVDSTENLLAEIMADEQGNFVYTVEAFGIVPWEHEILATVTEVESGLESAVSEAAPVSVILSSIRVLGFTFPWWLIVVAIGVVAALFLASTLWLILLARSHRQKMLDRVDQMKEDVSEDFSKLERDVEGQVHDLTVAEMIQQELEAEAAKINAELDELKTIEKAKKLTSEEKTSTQNTEESSANDAPDTSSPEETKS